LLVLLVLPWYILHDAAARLLFLLLDVVMSITLMLQCFCRAALRELVGDAEYFLGILPDGSGLAAPLVPGQRAPMQLGRQILAQLAGVPERADWKECTAGGPHNSGIEPGELCGSADARGAICGV
jgi:hypothetical protein